MPRAWEFLVAAALVAPGAASAQQPAPEPAPLTVPMTMPPATTPAHEAHESARLEAEERAAAERELGHAVAQQVDTERRAAWQAKGSTLDDADFRVRLPRVTLTGGARFAAFAGEGNGNSYELGLGGAAQLFTNTRFPMGFELAAAALELRVGGADVRAVSLVPSYLLLFPSRSQLRKARTFVYLRGGFEVTPVTSSSSSRAPSAYVGPELAFSLQGPAVALGDKRYAGLYGEFMGGLRFAVGGEDADGGTFRARFGFAAGLAVGL